MRSVPSNVNAERTRRLSLEQKLLRLARRYRAAEKRRHQREDSRSRRLRRDSNSPVVAPAVPGLPPAEPAAPLLPDRRGHRLAGSPASIHPAVIGRFGPTEAPTIRYSLQDDAEPEKTQETPGWQARRYGVVYPVWILVRANRRPVRAKKEPLRTSPCFRSPSASGQMNPGPCAA